MIHQNITFKFMARVFGASVAAKALAEMLEGIGLLHLETHAQRSFAGAMFGAALLIGWVAGGRGSYSQRRD